jgi:DNA polymerase III subunit gamma/tau
MRDVEEESKEECKNHCDDVSLKRESGKRMASEGAEKSEVPQKGSGRLSFEFKSVTHPMDCDNETEEPAMKSSERQVTNENVLNRRCEGERAVLHNWRNQSCDDEADESVESLIETKRRDLVRNEREGQLRRFVDKSETHIAKREVEHSNAENPREDIRTLAKQARRDRPSSKTTSSCRDDSRERPITICPSTRNEVHNSAEILSLLSLDEENPYREADMSDGNDSVGFSRMHRRTTSGIDSGSRSGSPLLMRDAVKARGPRAKCNAKVHSSKLSKHIRRQKDDSHTPTSTCSLNRNEDCKSSVRGSCDGTAFSGDDEMDAFIFPRHGCGIPCYWSRNPRSRSKNFPDCTARNLSRGLSNYIRRKDSNMTSRGKNSVQKDSPLSAYDSRRPGKVDLNIEALPLLTDGGESSVFSEYDGSDGSSYDFGEIFLEEAGRLVRKRSKHKGREKLELALTSESRELAVYADRHRNLSLKYRPRSFDELVGQNMVVQSLVNAVLKGKVAPVYLFQGPRGTGKTSTARIFAAALNCLSLEELRPCGFCRDCTAFASGKSVDVREVDATNSNGLERVKALLKSVALAPSFSRFRIIIIDECHMLVSETWAALLKCLEEPPVHAVFIFITSDPDKLPHSAVSRCQKHLFPKIKDSEIVSRLQKLAVEEDLYVDTDALDLIAIKSDGSLRDAEMMLDQLSLLGRRITLSLVHDLVGVVSDEKLLDLLDLALSADAASTVRRVREFIGSGIEPMALMSQLATLIMDILAGSCKAGDSKHKGIFFHRHALTEDDLERLRRALRILSEAEKQLRASNDQTTWLTAALLQFAPSRSPLFLNSAGTSVIQSPITLKNRNGRELLCFESPNRQKWDKAKHFDAQPEQLDWRTVKNPRESNRNGSLKTLCFMDCHGENKGMPLSNLHACPHISDYSPTLSGSVGGFPTSERVGGSPPNMDESGDSGQTDVRSIDTNKLDDIWKSTIEECPSSTLRKLLHTEGKLLSVSAAKGMAIAQLEFSHADHMSRAERSWKHIAKSLQQVLGCNVEVRFCLQSLAAEADNIKCRKGSIELPKLSASRLKRRASMVSEEGMHQSLSTAIDSEQRIRGETIRKMPNTVHKEPPMPAQHFREGILATVNMAERNDQSISCYDKQDGSRTSKNVIPDEQRLERAWSQEDEKCISGLEDIAEKEQKHSQGANNPQNGVVSSGGTVMIPFGVVLQQTEGKLASKAKTMQKNLPNDVQKQHSARNDDPHNLHSGSVNQNSFIEEENQECRSGSESGSILCWRLSKLDRHKARLQKRRQRRKSDLLMWVVPCANAKE